MKILILGAGKMGTWFADELCLKHNIAVFEKDPQKLKYLFRTERFTTYDEIKNFEPNLVLNAVNIKDTIPAFKEVMNYLPKDCIIADICSVKNGVSEFFKNSGFRFVSTHPMFGPTFAQMHKLKSQNAIIINESDEEGIQFFKNFYNQFGLKIHEMSFEEHDHTIAYSLAIPFTSTLVFSSCMEGQDAPGTTFQKHMKIAKGLLSEDDYLLSEILLTPNSLAQVEKIRDNLTSLLQILKDKNIDGLQKYIRSSRNKILTQNEHADEMVSHALKSNVGF
jgi:prephenate dehydrogenase